MGASEKRSFSTLGMLASANSLKRSASGFSRSSTSQTMSLAMSKSREVPTPRAASSRQSVKNRSKARCASATRS